MSRVLIGNLPPGTTIRNIDDFCSPFGRLLYVDVKNQGNSTLACVEYETIRNSQNLIRARHGHNYNGYTVQLKLMSEDSVSGPPEVRDIKRRQNSPAPSPSASTWSRNNNQSNNRTYETYDNNNGNNRKPSSNFDNDRGSYYNNNSNRGSVPMDTNMGNSLDFNQACRIVYERFINQGYNPTLAKERTLEFVNNMQGRSNHTGFTNNNISDYFDQTQGRGVGGMYSNNSDYFGQGMNTNNNFGNDSGNFNGNQNWAGGRGNNWGGSADSFSNSNWGSFNGPNNQQMPSSWGGGGGGGGDMSYPMQGNGFNNRSRRDGWNNGGNNVSNQGRVGGNQRMMGPQGPPPANVVDHESYTKSAVIRKKIELKITRGISTPRDLKNLQFHTQIMDDYERHMRFQRKMGGGGAGVKVDPVTKLQRYKSALGIVKKMKKIGDPRYFTPEDQETYAKNKAIVTEYEKAAEIASRRKNGKDELSQLKRYKSALGIVQKFKKLGPIQKLSPDDKKSYDTNKSIVDVYEKSIEALAKGKGGSRAIAAGPSSTTKTSVGVSAKVAYERKKQQLVRESKKNFPDSDFIRLSGAAKKKVRHLVSAGIEMADTKFLALHSSVVLKKLIDLKNAIPKEGNASGSNKQLVPVGAKPKSGAPQAKPATADPSADKPTGMSKKERAYLRAANKVVTEYESKNPEIESLTEKDIIQLRRSIRRLQIYHEKFDTPERKTKYDVLLSEKYDTRKVEKKSEESSGEAMEEGNKDEAEGGEDVEGEDAAEVEGGEEEAVECEEEAEGVEEEAEFGEEVEDDQGE